MSNETPQSNRLRRVGMEPREGTGDQAEQFVYMEDGPFWLVPVDRSLANGAGEDAQQTQE